MSFTSLKVELPKATLKTPNYIYHSHCSLRFL